MIIYVPTIQSTGTWFLMDLIQIHSKIKYMNSWQAMDRTKFPPDWSDDRALINIHIGISNEYWDNPVYHTNEKIKEDFMLEAAHTVIPLRDPLKALLTCHTRNWDMINITHIVNGFVQVKQWCDRHPDIHLFPVDIGMRASVLPRHSHPGQMTRYGMIRDLFTYLDLPLEPYMSIIAENWSKVNTIGERTSRLCDNYYYSRNIEKIIAELDNPFEGGGFKYLQSKQKILRPWLESVGYRSLLWWDN